MPATFDFSAHRPLVLPPATEAVTPFEVHVPQAAIEDLQLRLRLARWPDQELVEDWSQGVPLDAAKSLVDYWLNGYDWRTFEARLNSFPQFRTRIDGVGIYFIHALSPHPNATPILLTHGWPGSVLEFLNVIERLTDPVAFGGKAEDAFHVVVPAIPGYGFSDKPTEQGWNPARIARAWAVLMTQRLGYKHWVAQGGDWGAAITTALAGQAPEGLKAAHVNLPMVVPAQLPARPTEEERQALEDIERYVSDKAGYANQMNTRPQTIGYALNDSPVALATWMYEKFWEWTDNEAAPKTHSPATRCSMTSRCTGSPAPARPARACIGKAWARPFVARTSSRRRAAAWSISRCRWARAFSPPKPSSRHGRGQKRHGPTCSIGMLWTRAGILRRLNSRRFLPRNCGRHSGRFAQPQADWTLVF